LLVLLTAGVPSPAAAQAPPVAPPAAPPVVSPVVSPAVSPQDVQRVRDELDRLRREFDALRRAYDERLIALEQRLAQFGGGPSAPVAPSAPPAPSAPAAPADPAPQAAAGTSKVFNPDISVNGNFLAAAGRNPFATLGPLQLSEVEAAFQAAVDPYARADFYFAIGHEGIEVEEGFITFTSLPSNFQLKAGKMRAQFGKMNTLHTHSLPSADRPLVTGNLVGGDEGLADAGLSLSRLVNNPWVFLELTGEVYAGQSEVFQSTHRSRLAYVGRARAYKDLTESTNIDIGTSAAFGPATVDLPEPLISAPGAPTLQAVGMDKRLIGIDATFRYRPLERAIYQRLNVRAELIWSRQEMPTTPAERAFGMYVNGEYQFARRWYIGARADRSGRVTEADAIDTGASVFLTFWPTEFSQVRGQFRHIRFAEGVRANEFLFQFNFSIGAHGAHVF
jgi:hypothetical protein